MGGAARLQTRAARALVAPGVAAEGGGSDAVGVGVARTVGVARARVAADPPTKRRRIGLKVPQAEDSSSPAWLTLRGWLPGPEDLFDPPPPPCDPLTQPELLEGGVKIPMTPCFSSFRGPAPPTWGGFLLSSGAPPGFWLRGLFFR